MHKNKIINPILLFLFTLTLVFAGESPKQRVHAIASEYKGRGYVIMSSKKVGHIGEKSMSTFSATLYKGQGYLAVVGTEDFVQQIGIYVFDPDKKKMGISNKFTKSGSAITFFPKATGRYIFMVKASEKNVDFHFLLIAKSSN